MVKTSLTASLLLIATAARANDFKAAYVDIQRAVQEVDEGKAARTRLQSFAQDKQKAVEKEQTSLRADVDAFQKQSSTMADDARRKKEDELQKRSYEFAQKADKLRAELADQERKELSTIFPKLEKLLGDIATREGLTMVFDKSNSGLAWAPPALDLTNELIRTYNNTYKLAAAPTPTGTKTAPAPTPAPAPAPKK